MPYKSVNWFEQGSHAAEFMRRWEAEIRRQWEEAAEHSEDEQR